MSDPMRQLAIQQRRRLVATIMGALEKQVWPKIAELEQAELRRKVIGAVDVYHDFMLDVAKVYSSQEVDFQVNDEVLEMLRRIYREVRE